MFRYHIKSKYERGRGRKGVDNFCTHSEQDPNQAHLCVAELFSGCSQRQQAVPEAHWVVRKLVETSLQCDHITRVTVTVASVINGWVRCQLDPLLASCDSVSLGAIVYAMKNVLTSHVTIKDRGVNERITQKTYIRNPSCWPHYLVGRQDCDTGLQELQSVPLARLTLVPTHMW